MDVPPGEKGRRYKPASAVTDDEDSLQAYNAPKLLPNDENPGGPRRRPQRQGDHELLDPTLNSPNYGLQLTESDLNDLER